MTPFQAVTLHFDQACERLGVRDEVRNLMCTPDRSEVEQLLLSGLGDYTNK